MAIFTWPPTTPSLGLSPVDFHEAKEGSQDAAVSSKAQVYKTIWKVAWADAERAKAALLGFTVAKPAAGAVPAYFSRSMPHGHPKAPWLFCTDILRVEGREPIPRDADQMAAYKWAWLYCTYTKLFCTVLSDAAMGGTAPDESTLNRFVRKRRKSQLEFQSNRRGSWTWLDVAAGQPNRNVGLPIPWRVPLLRLLWTWMNIPIANLNEPYINDTIGTTNQFAFAGYRAGSLLLNGADWPDYSPIPGHDGLQVDVTFDVLYFPPVLGGPNYFPDPNRGNSYHEIGAMAGVTLIQPLPKRNWSPMFAPINV
jgi:hypothetical protein